MYAKRAQRPRLFARVNPKGLACEVQVFRGLTCGQGSSGFLGQWREVFDWIGLHWELHGFIAISSNAASLICVA